MVTDKDGNSFYLHWHPIADSDAVRALKEAVEAQRLANKAQSDISDMSYLKATFGKGKTSVDGGVVMSQMVAVADTENAEDVTVANVKAFLNGSDFAKDTDVDPHTETPCGKLILAAGIPETTESGSSNPEERAKEATTRIYEDGCIYSKNLHLQEGCSVGRLDIDKYGIAINGCKNTGSGFSAYLRSSLLSFGRTNNDGTQCTILRSFDINASDDADAFLTIDEDRGDAIRVTRGTFAGLRTRAVGPHRLLRADGRYSLSEYDFNVFFPMGDGTYQVFLPDEPLDGQEYWIETAGSNVTLISNTYPIWVHYSKQTVSAFSHISVGTVRFKFYKDAIATGEDEINGMWSATIIESRT